MVASQPRGLWLWVDGCCNGPMWAAVDLIPGSAMLLARGWKSFARFQGIGPDHILHFLFDGSTTVFVNLFGVSGVPGECCVESLSSNNVNTSGDSNDDSDVFSLKQEAMTPSSAAGSMEQSGEHGPVLRVRFRDIIVAHLLSRAGGGTIASRTPT
ncbi:hypothetical protein D1007_12115 [Hordeum vulgare]|nr:hypothetical protein D1007_12115 [Hordeum vulgare]